jgi:hypothetical protein
MTELYSVYQNARQERQEFLNRIIPLVLNDAHIDTWRGRATYAEHWETEFKAMEQHEDRARREHGGYLESVRKLELQREEGLERTRQRLAEQREELARRARMRR